jgi:hypothetical protein
MAAATREGDMTNNNSHLTKYQVPCMRPDFVQALDVTRPHTLLTENTRHSGFLESRCDDTGEMVLVPNIWYNQTYQVRVEAIRWDARIAEEQAERNEKYPPLGMSQAAAADMVRRFRERAARIRAEADRVEAAGRADYPVLASLTKLDYGAPVGIG